MRINEIFYSLQGEGFWTGTPIIFVRFSGCNLHCDFCDTQHEAFLEMTETEILSEIQKFPARRVCLTGGEPSLQITKSFIDLLRSKKYIIHIETNGTNALPDGIDWITLSPKNQNIALQKANELKIVYINVENVELEKWLSFDAAHFFLQPCSNQNTAEVIDYVLTHPQWRISLQVHKFLGIR